MARAIGKQTRPEPLDLAKVMTVIPGVGEQKAKALIAHFPSTPPAPHVALWRPNVCTVLTNTTANSLPPQHYEHWQTLDRRNWGRWHPSDRHSAKACTTSSTIPSAATINQNKDHKIDERRTCVALCSAGYGFLLS